MAPPPITPEQLGQYGESSLVSETETADLKQRSGSVKAALWTGYSARSIAVRLFLTCWILYALHFTPYVYRELYLSMSLAEKHSVHVDEYVDLHPDLFEIAGRGTYMGGNPGASILAAIPYALLLPIVNRVAPIHPTIQEAQAPRGQRFVYFKFLEKVRARGLDRRIGGAAAITSCFFMAPLSALSVVMMFALLLRFRFSMGHALGMALLYGFGTPIFFRTATLSLNLLVALLGLFAFGLLWWPSEQQPRFERLRYWGAGVLAGWALLTDYSGVVTVSILGLFALALQLRSKSFWSALKGSLWFLAGALGPILFLLYWQWYCYGNPWLPAQFHQPKVYYMGYRTDRGFGWPMPRALWALLFDPLYGLLVFAPILAVALYQFVLLRRGTNRIPARVAAFAWMFFLALWLFCSCIEYTLRFQWMDGVRYMVPAVPFLFLLVADALNSFPRVLTYLAASAAIVETWCLAIVRENPWGSITQVFSHGLSLPWLTAVSQAAPQYARALSSETLPVALYVVCGLIIWGIWRRGRPSSPPAY